MAPQKLQKLLQQAVELHRAGRLAEAEVLYRQARAGAPKNFDALHLSGTLAFQQGRIEPALDLLTRALRQDPRSAPCHMRLGLALLADNRPADAEKHLRRALKLKPDFEDAWENLAYCLKVQDRLAEALECHRRVVTLNPRGARGWSNQGLTLLLIDRLREALDCQDRALALDPAYAPARFGRAQTLHRSNRIAEAIAEYGRFLEAEPGHHQARSYRLVALQYLDSWTREQVFAEHVTFGRMVGAFPAPALPHTPDPDRRLRLAILSPDLRTHSCAFFLEPLLRHLDRSRFDVLLYHDHIREDAVTARLRALAGTWRKFVSQPDAVVERTIRTDQPDILIDLSGHASIVSRLPLFARRLAPVQISYLGYPDTTGLPAMDYRFTDPVADPEPDADQFATERLVRFAPTAWAYLPPPAAPAPEPPPCTRGRPFTFGCFNNPSKISDTTLRLWSAILRAVPGSRLLLKGQGFDDPAIREHFQRQCAAAEMPPDRVVLAGRTNGVAEHLACYHQVDVALDPFPYHGTTTTCEALWMGVPVVTLRGDRHLSRVGASLLTAVGHPEWIAANPDDYPAIAARLASEPSLLATLRTGMREEMLRSPLMDHAGQAARFGDALRRCWQEWCGTTAAVQAA